MMPQYHFISSLILALIIFYFTSSLHASLFCFLAGFMIDIDHLIDYWLYKRRIVISRELFQEFYKKWDKIPILYIP